MAEIKNVVASVHQRLLNLSRERGEDFTLTLTKYGLERLLYRLSISKHCETFVLKGALLFELWTKQRYRPTRDADFLAHGDSAPERFVAIFQELCAIQVPMDDGCQFNSRSVVAERIKEGEDYQGVRVTFTGNLGNAKLPVQIDIGFGDAVTPEALPAEYPTMLELPRPKLLAYPMETSIAEKFEAMVKLGMANSRMKDLYDIFILQREFSFEGVALQNAIANTFRRRRTALPKPGSTPLILTEDFSRDAAKQTQWRAFVNKNKSYIPPIELEHVMAALRTFLGPVTDAIANHTEIAMNWAAAGPWQDRH